jgi:hypothetical protein
MTLVAEWRTVAHAPVYEVSDCGDVRLKGAHRSWGAGYILKGNIIRGYRWYTLRHADGTKHLNSAHSLVLMAFVGPRPSPLHHAAHADSNRANNAVANLRWATLQENMNDGVAHGSWKGERHSRAILTENAVIAAREAHTCGVKISHLARKYGVHEATMSAVVNRKTWTHV